jgi:sec-independent protein translocase protein TatA
MFGTPGPVQLLIVGAIVLLFFGNRLPSVMRSLGQGITEFKKGIKDDEGADVSGNIEDKRDE